MFAGHPGRNKTHGKLVSEFYWKGMFADVSMSCHVCQIVGKPNQVIPPFPLQKVHIGGEAISKVLIDVVGPLPKRVNAISFS